jgi:hypothetical protein
MKTVIELSQEYSGLIARYDIKRETKIVFLCEGYK